MEFIDFHTHTYPEKIAKKATNFLREYCQQEGGWPGTSENLVIFGKAAGISKFVTLAVASKVEQVRKINDFAISQNNEYEDFYSFGTIHAGQEKIIEEIDYIRQKGLYGIKIHPEHQQFAIDDPRLFPAFDYLQQTGFPILFHCGDLKSTLSHPSRIKNVLDNFPKIRLVAAHFGGWEIWDQARAILSKADCYFDMSSTRPYLGAQKTADLINEYGEDKIFFGTDFPIWDQDTEVKEFLKLPISDDAKEKIASGNAKRFLGIE